ncbi:ribose-5-phosphate isomerase RpiA [Methanosphaera sp.]
MVNMDLLKDNVGKQAADLIKDGQIVGLGTGSTTHYFIRYLGERIKNEELNILGIPTSYQSLIIARESGINTTTLDEYDIDIAVDGADEVNPNLDLIKGGGAAHTLEKLIDSSAKKFVVIVDESKMVEELGEFPVPLEIIPDALRVVKETLADMGGKAELRMGIQKDGPVITDNGNFILDTKFNKIRNPQKLEKELNTIPGVLENGIFAGLADKVIVGKMSHIEEIDREDIL